MQWHNYISDVYKKPNRLKIGRKLSKLWLFKKYMLHQHNGCVYYRALVHFEHLLSVLRALTLKNQIIQCTESTRMMHCKRSKNEVSDDGHYSP